MFTSIILTSKINQVAVPDVVEAAKDADILIFVVPHQFIPGLCAAMLGKIKSSAVGLSLIKVTIPNDNSTYMHTKSCVIFFKGFAPGEGTNIKLISKIIEEKLKIPCSVLMGANLANEVAEEHFCETTIGTYI